MSIHCSVAMIECQPPLAKSIVLRSNPFCLERLASFRMRGLRCLSNLGDGRQVEGLDQTSSDLLNFESASDEVVRLCYHADIHRSWQLI